MILQRRIGELERRKVEPARLLLKRTLTKAPGDYAAETRMALAARQLADTGVKVHPGERLRFLVRDAKAKDRSRRVHAEGVGPLPAYDLSEYVRLLTAAGDEVLMTAPRTATGRRA